MSDLSPFASLVGIARRSQSAAQPLPAKEDAQTHWAGLGFRLLEHQFVVAMDEVAELMRVPETTRLPGVKSWVNGIANVRGRLMAVVDLSAYLGQPSAAPRVQRRILVVEGEELYIGYMVDESLGILHFPRDSYQEGGVELAEVLTPYLEGAYQVAGTVWPVLSLVRLAEDPKLQRLAAGAEQG